MVAYLVVSYVKIFERVVLLIFTKRIEKLFNINYNRPFKLSRIKKTLLSASILLILIESSIKGMSGRIVK